MTELRLSLGPTELITFTLQADGFVFRSGDQELGIVGDWPTSLEDISRIVRLLTEVGRFSDLESADRRSLVTRRSGTCRAARG